jgi:hypothetical protein
LRLALAEGCEDRVGGPSSGGAAGELGISAPGRASYDLSRDPKIMELVSAGKIQEVFPFRPNPVADIGPDFVAEEDLVEASPEPLSHAERAAHI